MSRLGPVGKLGRWTATHFRTVAAVWLLIAVAFGIFAPRVETALSGAGWEASGSPSVQARNLISQNFRSRQLRPDGGRPLADPDGARPTVSADPEGRRGQAASQQGCEDGHAARTGHVHLA